MNMRYIALLPIAMLLMPNDGWCSETFLLKPNYIWCRERQVFVDLVDIAGEKQWKDAMSMKIYQGDCSPIPSMVQVVDLEEKKTAKGNSYYCFKIKDVNSSSRDVDCTFPEFVTTLRAEIRSRTGAYRLSIDNQFVKVAECVEGGKVSLSKEKSGWKRQSMIFPVEQKNEEVISEKEVSRALKDGCKGVDYTAQ